MKLLSILLALTVLFPASILSTGAIIKESNQSHVIENFPHVCMGWIKERGAYPGDWSIGKCYLGAFLMPLKYYGETELDFIHGLTGDACGFMYIPHVPFAFTGGGPEGYPMEGGVEKIMEGVPPLIGYDVHLVKGMSWGESWGSLKDRIDRDTPVIVYVDIFYLRDDLARASPWWREVFPADEHADHSMVVVGYDEGEGIVYLFDPTDHPDQEATLDNFDKAWREAALVIPEEMDQPCWMVSLSPDGSPKSLKELVTSSLRNNAELTFGGSVPKVYLGVEGIRKLAEDITADEILFRDLGPDGWSFHIGSEGYLGRRAISGYLETVVNEFPELTEQLTGAADKMAAAARPYRQITESYGREQWNQGGADMLGAVTPTVRGKEEALQAIEEMRLALERAKSEGRTYGLDEASRLADQAGEAMDRETSKRRTNSLSKRRRKPMRPPSQLLLPHHLRHRPQRPPLPPPRLPLQPLRQRPLRHLPHLRLPALLLYLHPRRSLARA